MRENIAAVLFSYIKHGKFFECANKEKIRKNNCKGGEKLKH